MALYLHHPSSYEHDTGGHPENARRLRAIESALEAKGWLGLDRVEAPAATREQLERVHSGGHIDAIESFCERGGGMIDLDTVASAGSYEAALHAAGGPIHAVDAMLANGERVALCALRPPGHHAETDRAMGFCLFNNAAAAAAHAIATNVVERVLILDWDVHHGNGTAEIFDGSSEVLYASIHESPLYPGTGAAEETGTGAGEGYTVNLPVAAGAGPDEFLSLVQNVVVPIGREHRPGLIIISAGFDAHHADPLAGCRLDEAAYADMAASVRDLGAELEAPILVCLEGGYDVDALAASMIATVEGLTGSRTPREAPKGPASPYLRRLGERWPVLAR